MSKNRKHTVLLLISSVLISFVIIATGQFVQEKYTFEIGQVAPKTEYAPREIPNKVATEQKKERIANSLESEYIIDATIGEKAKESVELLFSYLKNIEIDEEAQDAGEVIGVLKDKSPLPLYTEQYEQLLALEKDERIALRDEILEIVSAIYNDGITSDNQSKVINDSEEKFQNRGLSPAQMKIGHDIIALLVMPNMMIDAKATEALIEETIDKVEPVIVLEGEKIIEQGTRITEETYELLREAGFMKEEVSNSVKRFIGAMMIVLLVAGMASIYMIKQKNIIQLDNKEKTLMFALYVIAVLIIRMAGSVDFVYIPLTIIPMLVAILISPDIAIVLNMIIVIIGSLVYKGDISYVLYFMITGTISALSVVNIKQRNRTLAIAAYMGVINTLVILGLRLFMRASTGMDLVVEATGAFLIGILMLIIVVGSLPFWEIAFDIVTPIKLLELTNPDQELLKRLLLEATGTYHHSLLVANLAETAANEIGASPLLARVGGYYHDIGKLGYVNYYKENQVGENPHDTLEPDLSAQIILSHVTRGEELADQYNLPKCVKDIISQHHGTTLVQYFYVKASKMENGETVQEEDYQYKGPKPQTKEAAIVMLADVVEATVRSMMPFADKDQSIEKTVTKIIKSKLESGQLDDSELMIKDIDKIIGAFNRLLVGMYHERIAYPSKEEV